MRILWISDLKQELQRLAETTSQQQNQIQLLEQKMYDETLIRKEAEGGLRKSSYESLRLKQELQQFEALKRAVGPDWASLISTPVSTTSTSTTTSASRASLLSAPRATSTSSRSGGLSVPGFTKIYWMIDPEGSKNRLSGIKLEFRSQELAKYFIEFWRKHQVDLKQEDPLQIDLCGHTNSYGVQCDTNLLAVKISPHSSFYLQNDHDNALLTLDILAKNMPEFSRMSHEFRQVLNNALVDADQIPPELVVLKAEWLQKNGGLSRDAEPPRRQYR